jgi:hypothetical protein
MVRRETVMAKIKSRKRLKSKTFADKKNRKYPIPDLAHARNAIARVRQHGSPKQKKAVYAMVKRKFPALAKRSKVIKTR